MKSNVIKKNENQMVLDFEQGLTERYASVRECVAQGVYQRGLKRVAGDLDQAPGNLSVQLSDDPTRHFSLDSFELYLEKTGDMTPLYYLVERFLGEKQVPAEDDLQRQLEALALQILNRKKLAA